MCNSAARLNEIKMFNSQKLYVCTFSSKNHHFVLLINSTVEEVWKNIHCIVFTDWLSGSEVRDEMDPHSEIYRLWIVCSKVWSPKVLEHDKCRLLLNVLVYSGIIHSRWAQSSTSSILQDRERKRKIFYPERKM